MGEITEPCETPKWMFQWRQGVLEEDLLLSAVKVVAEEFGDCAREGRAEELDFERGEVDSVEGFGEV